MAEYWCEESFLKIRLLILFLAIAWLAASIVLFNSIIIYPASATETFKGREIFNANCASCHIGGNNILVEHKTLEKEALAKYLKNYDTEPIQAIIHQIQNGKGAMPSFKNKLSDQEMIETAAYVFQKAEKGWNNE
ncbi:cytochrome c class I [Anabaena cylindrica PCC 7122]|uniref:Cytochrome c class I n=1 Tax=Anabaena cylindrica (strain ATCC 27899 / PCC 7122) TaxID=272123 RepID=K9ZDR5_ANACC|nr:cytochrome c class I [Anabaena cylindrica PCC 7122]BAY05669.1 cytochrome c class I [Anabaena cylindrica PCC 7122]